MLEPKRPLRERILGIGGFGSGKSYSWLSIARQAQKTGSPAKFYCLDTDAAIERMLAEEFQELENVKLYNVFDWSEYESALDEAIQNAGPDDWIVVDMIDLAWDAVQAYFTDQVFDKEISVYFLEIRKALKGQRLQTFDGWRDWTVINKLYSAWMNKLIYKAKSHVFCTAKVEAVDSDKDDKETRLVYGAYGVKPKGQKALGHQFHTVLLFTCVKPGDWIITTIKDRGREPFTGQKLVNFPMQYLVGKAGWKL